MNGPLSLNTINTPFQSPDDIPEDKCFSDTFLESQDLENGSIQNLISQREYGLIYSWNSSCSNKLIPNTFFSEKADFDSWAYNGQFSPTGNIYCCTSKRQIKIFNTVDPFNWTLQRFLTTDDPFWAYTDMDISPCEKFIILCSVDPKLRLATVENNATSDNMHFDSISSYDEVNADTGIFSVKFSGDGSSVIFSTNRKSIVLYDLIKRQNIINLQKAHDDDVNSICFLDPEKENIVVSGSDESCIKIWDMRCLNSDGSAHGVLIGHREGITHVAPHSNGISLISNSKDQTLKLWDIRTITSQKAYIDFKRSHRYQTYFDYRWEDYPLRNYRKRLSADSSLLTFKRHTVRKTCIKCYFSPLFTTGNRFIYSGSCEGNVYIFDSITGKTVRILEDTVRVLPPEKKLVRDVSWHPFIPLICATSFRRKILSYSFL
ncbi:unnamed protein product [Blepharisma stoltei]|uniref:Uncharacterized protein n=1 Tax=Blepharisma stoltei TaxID=1481888 RepID=A0AAU9K787_9CILI|nr:unnamed protein product [Blepharisma stoltei]